MTNQSENITMRVSNLMKLSAIVGRYIDVQRATVRHGRPETDGEHTLHLQYVAVAYAAKYHPELDIAKVSLYGLVHDFVEVYAGDTNSLTTTNEAMAQKVIVEKQAFEQLQSELGGIWPEFIGYIHDYETLSSKEARFIKCFDKCDPAFTHFESGGQALHDMGISSPGELRALNQATEDRMASYSSEFADVIAVRRELTNRVVAVTFPES